jgi:hypothetical protein
VSIRSQFFLEDAKSSTGKSLLDVQQYLTAATDASSLSIATPVKRSDTHRLVEGRSDGDQQRIW